MKQTTIKEHEEALARIDVLMDTDPAPETDDGKELELLLNQVEQYEDIHYPMNQEIKKDSSLPHLERFDTLPEGWKLDRTWASPEHGWVPIYDGKSLLNGGRKGLLKVDLKARERQNRILVGYEE